MCDKWNQNIIKNIAIKKYVIKSKIVKRLTKLILKKLMTFEGVYVFRQSSFKIQSTVTHNVSKWI